MAPSEENKLSLTNLGHVLDHPEAVAWGPDQRVYAGGEEGQLYRFGLDGPQQRPVREGRGRLHPGHGP